MQAEQAEIVARAKRFLTIFEESAVIDAKALELAHAPDKAKRIQAAADELVREMTRIGCTAQLTRYCRSTFVVLLAEKIAVAEAGGESCPKQVSGYVGSSFPIAKWQELGTAHIPPRPFLSTAAIGLEPQLHAMMAATVTAAMIYGGHNVELWRKAFEIMERAGEDAREMFEEETDDGA
jgi:hypothetical protein